LVGRDLADVAIPAFGAGGPGGAGGAGGPGGKGNDGGIGGHVVIQFLADLVPGGFNVGTGVDVAGGDAGPGGQGGAGTAPRFADRKRGIRQQPFVPPIQPAHDRSYHGIGRLGC
jgi:hypothetical protein